MDTDSSKGNGAIDHSSAENDNYHGYRLSNASKVSFVDIQAINAELQHMMRVGEAAKYLGVSSKTLRNWDRSGRLPAKRNPMTRYRYYWKEDLDRLIERTLQSRQGR